MTPVALDMESTALVWLEHVGKKWGEKTVLKDVGLQLHAGEIVGVAGGNGVGKTTLLRITAGIILPDEGTVRFRGADVEGDLSAFRREIGLLSAGDRGLYARLSVEQNLEFWAGLAGLTSRRRRRRISGVLSEFEIVELRDQRADRLSMGQRQRVRLAMTFLHDPLVVLLDEPTTSLDPAGIELLNAALGRLLDRGGAVLWASPEPALPFSGRSWLLRSGRLHQVVEKSPRADPSTSVATPALLS